MKINSIFSHVRHFAKVCSVTLKTKFVFGEISYDIRCNAVVSVEVQAERKPNQNENNAQ